MVEIAPHIYRNTQISISLCEIHASANDDGSRFRSGSKNSAVSVIVIHEFFYLKKLVFVI